MTNVPAQLVVIGDLHGYLDLFESLIALQEVRPGRFCPIIGDQDLALLRALAGAGADARSAAASTHAAPSPLSGQRVPNSAIP